MDLANEINGQSGTNGNPAGRPAASFDDLPYFQEYLQNVLRPRIERTIEALDRSLTDAAWRHIIATVAADQHIAPEIAGPLIRPLLEQKLGLKMEARLEAQFGPRPAPGQPDATPTNDPGVARAAGVDGPEVLTVRRRPVINPLANAVANNTRPLGR